MSEEGRKTLRCSIVNAERAIHDGEAVFVGMRSVLGELGVMPGHAPLLAKLAPGPVEVRAPDGGTEAYFISGGLVQVMPREVCVLADIVERADEIDEARAERARDEARQKLAVSAGDLDYAEVMMQLERATARLQALRLRRKKTG